MGFDNLPGDRQTQTRILSERFRVWPVGVKPFENPFRIFGWNAWPVVGDRENSHLILPEQVNLNLSTRLGNKGSGVFNEIGNDLAQSTLVA